MYADTYNRVRGKSRYGDDAIPYRYCEMSRGYEPGWGLEVLPYFRKKMGNSATSLERHVEQAKKTGVCNLQGMNLNKVSNVLPNSLTSTIDPI